MCAHPEMEQRYTRMTQSNPHVKECDKSVRASLTVWNHRKFHCVKSVWEAHLCFMAVHVRLRREEKGSGENIRKTERLESVTCLDTLATWTKRWPWASSSAAAYPREREKTGSAHDFLKPQGITQRTSVRTRKKYVFFPVNIGQQSTPRS